MTPPADLTQILAFILETDRLKTVTRKIRVRNTAAHTAEQLAGQVTSTPILDRLENSAEHSWQLALFALSLQPFAAEPVNMQHVLQMLLLHDLGEIDTGDTMAFVEGGWAERKQDELAAVQRIFGLLPPAQAALYEQLWQEFEHGDTPESRFANAVDRAMPPLLNLSNNGGSWVEHNISHARVVARIRDQVNAGAPALWTHLETELQHAQDAGWFGTTANVKTSPPTS